MTRRRHLGGAGATALTLVVLVAGAAGGCGTRVRSQLNALSTTTAAPATTTSTTAPAVTTTTLDPAAVKTQITSNWETFFNAQTPLAQREALLENGKQYEQAIITASKNPLQAQASAKVTAVQLTDAGRATVTYDVLVNGQPVLSASTGTALLQDGVWKVSAQSFCALVTLQGSIPGC